MQGTSGMAFNPQQQNMNNTLGSNKRKAEEDPAPASSGTDRPRPSPPPESQAPPAPANEQPQKHIYGCALCRVEAATQEGLEEHMRSEMHKNGESALKTKKAKAEGGGCGDGNTSFYCSVCSLHTSGEESFKEHCLGKKHKAAMQKAAQQREEAGFKDSATAQIVNNTGSGDMVSQAAPPTPVLADSPLHADEMVTTNTIDTGGGSGSKIDKGKVHRGGDSLFFCSDCNLKATSKEQLEEHMKGKKHKAKVASAEKAGGHQHKVPPKAGTRPTGTPDTNSGGDCKWHSSTTDVGSFFCSACNISTSCQKDLDVHKLGKKHKTKAAAAAVARDKFFCNLCLVSVPREHLAAHLNGEDHKTTEKLAVSMPPQSDPQPQQQHLVVENLVTSDSVVPSPPTRENLGKLNQQQPAATGVDGSFEAVPMEPELEIGATAMELRLDC